MSSGLAAGTIFAGRYRVVGPIASGGMGAVYEVIHLETARRRALKVMLPHILQSDELRERFQLEAKVAAHIESEFIVDVFDAGFDPETQMPFLVMELLRGEELSKRLKRQGRLPAPEVVALLHQTALALDKTHRASIVHRDLKPENLFLTEREDGPPRIKVLDFGIAKILAESATSGATQSIGTPLYMAPEQFNPRIRLTPAADLYALAMVTFTLLVGTAYWFDEARGGNIFALATVAMHGPHEPASQRAAARSVTLPPSFDAWFARATAANPAHRFATATEMIAALAQSLGMPPPGRLAMISLSGAENAPFSQSGSVPARLAAQVATPPGSVTPAPALTLPTSALATALPTAVTPPAPALPASPRRVWGIAIGAAMAAGVLVGVSLSLAPRSGGGSVVVAGSATAMAPAPATLTANATASAHSPVTPPAEGTIPASATAMAPAPATLNGSTAASVPSAVAPATGGTSAASTAGMPAGKLPSAPSARAPDPVVQKQKKYSRD